MKKFDDYSKFNFNFFYPFKEGPGKNKLLNGDEILFINDEDVEFASRDYVISLIRTSTDKIKLVVKQPTVSF